MCRTRHVGVARHAHVPYGLGNSDKGGGNISLGVVATGSYREYFINVGYNSLSGLTTLCDSTQECPVIIKRVGLVTRRNIMGGRSVLLVTVNRLIVECVRV